MEDESTGETVMTSGWCVGYCERTGERGDFPAETVYVLPTLSKPPVDILVSVCLVKKKKLITFSKIKYEIILNCKNNKSLWNRKKKFFTFKSGIVIKYIEKY